MVAPTGVQERDTAAYLQGCQSWVLGAAFTSSAFTPGSLPAACLLSELGLEVGVCITFCLGSTGECLPVIPTAMRHDGARQPPSSTFALLNEAPDCVQGTADLE